MSATWTAACPFCHAPAALPVEGDARTARCASCNGALFTGRPTALKTASFDAHAKADLPLMLDFWAPWCGPCKEMGPLYEAAAADFEPRVRMAKVNTDEEPALMQRFAIKAVPSLMMFQRGAMIGRLEGGLPDDYLRLWIEHHLGKCAPPAGP